MKRTDYLEEGMGGMGGGRSPAMDWMGGEEEAVSEGMGEETPKPEGGKKKVSAEKAGFMPENEHCSDCRHFNGQECDVVDVDFGMNDPDLVSCWKYFEAKGGGEEGEGNGPVDGQPV